MNSNRINILSLGIFYLVFICFIVILSEKLTIDERATTQILNYEFKEMILIVAHDVHPPLFYILVRPIYTIGSIYSVKIFSVICGICTLFVIYDILRWKIRWMQPKILTLFIITVPNIVLHFTIARMYSLFIMFEAIGLNLTIRLIDGRFIRKNKILHLVLFVSIRIASLYTHYFSVIMLCFNVLIILVDVLYSLIKFKTLKNLSMHKIYFEITSILVSCLSISTLFPWIAFQYQQLTGETIKWGILGIPGLLEFLNVMNSVHQEPEVPYAFVLFINDGLNLYGALWPQTPFRMAINIALSFLFFIYFILSLKYGDLKEKLTLLSIFFLFLITFFGFYAIMSRYAIPHYSRYMSPVILYVLFPFTIEGISKSRFSNKIIFKILIGINILNYIVFFFEYYISGVILLN